MVKPHQKDKNTKQSEHTLVPYEKGSMENEALGSQQAAEEHTQLANELSGSDFLLSIAGMFSSGVTDTSEHVENYVAEAVKKKFS